MNADGSSVRTGAQPPGLFCSAGAVGGAQITGVGSPAGELLPMIALLALFVGAGVWMFRRFGEQPQPQPARPELPAGAPRAAEPATA